MDSDGSNGLLSRSSALRSHEGDSFAFEANLLLGEQWLILVYDPVQVYPGYICCRKDTDDSGYLLGLYQIQGDYPGVCLVTPEYSKNQGFVQMNIVAEKPTTPG